MAPTAASLVYLPLGALQSSPTNRNAALRPHLLHAIEWSALVDDFRTFLLDTPLESWLVP